MRKFIVLLLGLSFLIPAVAEAKSKRYKKRYLYVYKYRYRYKKYRHIYKRYRRGVYKANSGVSADKVKLEEMIKELF